MFDQFTTDLPSSLSDRVCRLGIVPEENNFVLAHAHVQLYRVHAGEESGGGGGCSVLTSSLGRRGQRSEVSSVSPGGGLPCCLLHWRR